MCFFSFLKVYAGLLLRASNMTEKVTDITAGRQVKFNICHGSLWQRVNVFNEIQQKVNSEMHIIPTLRVRSFLVSADNAERESLSRGGVSRLCSPAVMTPQ